MSLFYLYGSIMEQQIYFTNNEFDHYKLSISQPTSIQGGAYFTKVKMSNDILYLQLPKCCTKQGLITTNKKAYMDLMFNNEDEDVIEWFEKLEAQLINLIHQKKDLWFQNEMEKEDIEDYFSPICRPFRGGKYHLIRINIPRNKTLSSQYHCNVYDENENIIPIQEINEKHSIIPCVEIQGIKFSARNFQLEIQCKQIMILNNKPLFNSCIIKKNSQEKYSKIEEKNINKNEIITANDLGNKDENEDNISDNITGLQKYIIENLTTDDQENDDQENDDQENAEQENDDQENAEQENAEQENDEQENDEQENDERMVNQENEEIVEKNNIEGQVEKNISTSTSTNIFIKNDENDEKGLEEKSIESTLVGLEDITKNVIVNNNKSKIILKKPNEVYYEIYKIAKDKAKQHKKAAISHYLEAKNIKNTYLLDDLDNSDESSEEDEDSEKIKNEINEIVEELT